MTFPAQAFAMQAPRDLLPAQVAVNHADVGGCYPVDLAGGKASNAASIHNPPRLMPGRDRRIIALDLRCKPSYSDAQGGGRQDDPHA